MTPGSTGSRPGTISTRPLPPGEPNPTSRPSPPWAPCAWRPSGRASAPWCSACCTATRGCWPRRRSPSTIFPVAVSSWASGPAGTTKRPRPSATTSLTWAPASTCWKRRCPCCATCSIRRWSGSTTRAASFGPLRRPACPVPSGIATCPSGWVGPARNGPRAWPPPTPMAGTRPTSAPRSSVVWATPSTPPATRLDATPRNWNAAPTCCSCSRWTPPPRLASGCN